PKNNGVAERRLALIDMGARAHIYSAGLGEKLWLWGEAMLFATFVLNRTSTKANQGKTP
ncbi:unnamed protein product, partial [Discosporangium mesarthrocarpum]